MLDIDVSNLDEGLYILEIVSQKDVNKVMLPLSLSYDHRGRDGAEGARFCAHLRESLGKDFAYKLAV